MRSKNQRVPLYRTRKEASTHREDKKAHSDGALPSVRESTKALGQVQKGLSMKIRNAIQAICCALSLGSLSLAILDQQALAVCEGCSPKFCAWYAQPTATLADAADGEFNTAMDSDSNELTISWCWSDGNPLAGGFTMNSTGNINIASVTYTPSTFGITSCVGDQTVAAHGFLSSIHTDGTLVTKAQIGAAPGCSSTKSLAIDSQ
jgi:hypothetical protein